MQAENKKGSFSFINEKRKEKPVNKKKILLHTVYTVLLAVVFGLVASFVFAFFQPRISAWLYPEQRPVVSIPKDDEESTEDSEGTEDLGELTTEDSELPEEDSTQEGLPTEDTELPEDTQTEPVIIQAELEIEDYQKLQNKMYAIGRAANRFVVTVTGVKSDTDWFNNPYESKGQSSGIIIANNEEELLILTERKSVADGNSLGTLQGTLVMAVGSPLGTNYSILTGNVTSTSNEIFTLDNNFTVFTTNIIGSSSGSGVLINMKGEVIGLVMQDYSGTEDRNTLTALSISGLKTIIEMLSNGQDIPYIGLTLMTVNNNISREYEIPKGAYIKGVKMDSPAMIAGLQSGDIITALDDKTIMTVGQYESILLAKAPGDELVITLQRQGTDGYTEITCTVTVGTLQ